MNLYNLKQIPLRKRLDSQLQLLKFAEELEEEKQFDLELVNSNLKDIVSQDFEFFSELEEMKILEEIKEKEFNEDVLRALSDRDELLEDYIEDLDDVGKRDLIEKVEGLVSKEGEVGKVYEMLEKLNDPKVKDILKVNMSEMYTLLASENYERVFDKLSESSAKMYTLWSRMSPSHKQEVVSKSKDILKDMVLGLDEEGDSIGGTFNSSLEEQVPAPKWKGFFKSIFYEGLFEPFFNTLKGKGTEFVGASFVPGNRVVVSSKNNVFYGLRGKIKEVKKGGLIEIELTSLRDIVIPIEDIKSFK